MNHFAPGFVPYVSRFPVWVDGLLLQLDYFWFVALLAWSIALISWWWHPRRAAFSSSAWGWLPWSAAAGVGAAAIEFWLLNSDVTPRPKPILDATLGLLPMLAAAGWWWQSSASRSARSRWWCAATIVPLAAVGVLRFYHAPSGTWLTVATALLATAPWWRRPGASLWSGAALLLTALLPLSSAVGPMAVQLWLYQPFLPPNASALLAGVFQALAASVAVIGLGRHAMRSLDAEARARLWPDVRPFLIGAALWSTVCLAIAVVYTQQNVATGRRFAMELVQRIALQLDAAALDAALGPAFQIPKAPPTTEHNPTTLLLTRAPHLTNAIREPLLRVLNNTARGSRAGLKAVSIVTLRDGWFVVAMSSNPIIGPGHVRLARPTTPQDHFDFDHRMEVIETPISLNAGSAELQRLPLVSRTHGMLGWLEFCQSRGGYAPFRARTAPFIGSVLGTVVAALFFVQRQSFRQREVALRAAAIAEESARVKTDFLAKVSHELRTPLQSILGYGELLHEDVASEPGRARLAALKQNGQLMLRLVNDLLDLSTVEIGGFRFVEKPAPLVALVRETLSSLQPRAAAKGLTLHHEIAGDVPAWAVTDAERIRQIVINLVGNAVKFTARGRIDVSLRVAANDSVHHTLELAVRDTGPGIPPADQSRLFQPFFRLDPAISQEGSGLGLALTAGLCRSAGGSIAVESDGENGSCFRARFVVRPCAPLAPSPKITGLHGKRILIADDNALVRDLFAVWLSGLGAECETASDGEQAMARAAAASFDAVVLDLAMPRLDGLTVARRWRAAGQSWRIVGVSAHASARDREQALAAGMDAFLTKPVELAALASALGADAAPTLSIAVREKLRARLSVQFRSVVKVEAAAVRAALAQRDWTALHASAHHLKSSAGVVGDDQLYTACAAIEDAADARDATAADHAWTTCEQALDKWLH